MIDLSQMWSNLAVLSKFLAQNQNLSPSNSKDDKNTFSITFTKETKGLRLSNDDLSRLNE